MADLQQRSSNNTSYRPHLLHSSFPGFLILCAFLLASCGYTAQASPVSPAAPAAPATSTSTSYPIKVFFSQAPVSLTTNNSAVYAVDRMSPSLAVGTFAIQLLIAGPTASERGAGYFTELNTMLSGSSNCSTPLPVGGPDFTLTLDHKGSVLEKGTATLKFCRTLTSGGIGADARVQAEINATLKQFANIKKVVILTKDGHCFADNAGGDRCLH